MTENGYLLLGLLIVILVISLVAIASNKNVRQKIHFLGAKWDFRSKANTLEEKKVSVKNNSLANERSNSFTYFGEQNQFEGSIGDIAGRDIVHDEIQDKNVNTFADTSGVDLGKNNTYKKNLGDVAGRDIKKDPKEG